MDHKEPLLLDKVPAFWHCRSHFTIIFLLSLLTILTINVFPFGEFCTLVKDENVNNGSLSKQNNSQKKKKNSTPQNKESYHALLITQRTGKLEIS